MAQIYNFCDRVKPTLSNYFKDETELRKNLQFGFLKLLDNNGINPETYSEKVQAILWEIGLLVKEKFDLPNPQNKTYIVE